MKIHILIKALVLVVSLNAQMAFSQLSGMALLDGQTSHSGIKVKFTAASGTAVTDSCLTGTSGNYSINIPGGLYYVSLSRNGYQTIMYNNANVTTLTNTVVLPTMTLAVGTVSYVSGAVSGSWPGNMVYMVTGNLDVPNGTTLTIQPGAEIKFLGNYSLTVHGVLNATGTGASPIRFIPAASTGSWSEVNLYGGPNTLDYCDFSDFSGINNWNAAFRISNCRITNADRIGIQLVDGSGTVENNDITNSPIGISGFANSATITCNRISAPLYKNNFNVTSRGINVVGSDRFIDNEIWDYQEGIFVRSLSNTPFVRNNYVHDSRVGVVVEANASAALVIANNTLHYNQYGIYSTHPGLTFCNNVVTSSTVAVMGSGMTCDHNVIFGCITNFSLSPSVPGLGQVVNINSNGDPIDSYYNLFIDPDYGTKMPSFLAGSPVLNAGNTAYGSNIGANVNTQCFASLTTAITENNRATGFRAFPNPSFGLFTIDLPGASRLRIYGITGVEILSQEVNEDRISVDISGYSPGIYFCEILGKSGVTLIRLINL